MKKAAAFLLTLFLLFSLSLTVFADPGHPRAPYDENVQEDGELQDEGNGVPDDPTQAPTDATDAAEPTDAQEPSGETGTTQSVPDGQHADALDKQEPTGSVLADPNINDEDAQDEEEENHQGVIIGVAVCGSILLILLIIIAVLLLRKKQPSGNHDPDIGSGRGIPIEIEVLSGMCYNAELDFRLRRNLTIGTDKGCDLVFEDAKMRPMHAAISVTDGGIMLEETSDAGVTYIGGMKIFAPNRLRSGDIVTIGSTSFRVIFEEN